METMALVADAPVLGRRCCCGRSTSFGGWGGCPWGGRERWGPWGMWGKGFFGTLTPRLHTLSLPICAFAAALLARWLHNCWWNRHTTPAKAAFVLVQAPCQI